MITITKAQFLEYYENGWLYDIIVLMDQVIARKTGSSEAVRVIYP